MFSSVADEAAPRRSAESSLNFNRFSHLLLLFLGLLAGVGAVETEVVSNDSPAELMLRFVLFMGSQLLLFAPAVLLPWVAMRDRRSVVPRAFVLTARCALVLVLVLWATELLFETARTMTVDHAYDCDRVSSEREYNGGRVWEEQFDEELVTLLTHANANISHCREFMPTVLDSKIGFDDLQVQFFNSDVEGCMSCEPFLRWARQRVCEKTGRAFHLAPSSPFSCWILNYTEGGQIKRHVDNEMTVDEGLTISFTLSHSNVTVPAPDVTSHLVDPDVVSFIPHIRAMHHTPVVGIGGHRMVLQLKGSAGRFDTPLLYIQRKLKNVAYLRMYSLLVPHRLLTAVKRLGHLELVQTGNDHTEYSAEKQLLLGRSVRATLCFLGQYSKYLVYCWVLLRPGRFRTTFYHWLAVMEALGVLSLLTQFGELFDAIDWSFLTLVGASLGVLLFQIGSYQLGHARMLFANEVLRLKDPPATGFPYSVGLPHPMCWSVTLMWVSLLWGAKTPDAALCICGHVACVWAYTWLEETPKKHSD